MGVLPAAVLVLLSPALPPAAGAADPVDELARISRFLESDQNGPAVLGRILKNDFKDLRTPGGVSIDGTTTTIYHTLERTPDGLRLKQSTVHDSRLFELGKDSVRVEPGRSGYRVEVAEIELKRVTGGSRVQGYLRNISNSRYDPIGWSVEVSDARVTGQDGGKRGTLVLTTRQVTTSGTFAAGGALTPSLSESVVTLEVDKSGKLVRTTTITAYTVDPKTGTRTKVAPDPKNKIDNPETYTSREQ